MNLDNTLKKLQILFDEQIKVHGPNVKGVDWNSERAQFLRFEQLLKLCEPLERFSINDYGCGYGALIDFLKEKGYLFQYQGFDISSAMIANARAKYAALGNCTFYLEESLVPKADYTVASGLFNLKLGTTEDEWKKYILTTLKKISQISLKGFAFNMLTKYSDSEKMRSDLYYGDPCFFFDYCKLHFSKNVALLHDYGLYDFTILVRF